MNVLDPARRYPIGAQTDHDLLKSALLRGAS
jgi:hypothetical protein